MPSPGITAIRCAAMIVLRSTRIVTIRGVAAASPQAAGDFILLADGGASARRLRWPHGRFSLLEFGFKPVEVT